MVKERWAGRLCRARGGRPVNRERRSETSARPLRPAFGLAAAFVACALAAPAQPVASTWRAPRTPWGHPDLQGIWTNVTATPLERPRDLAGRTVLTEEERA